MDYKMHKYHVQLKVADIHKNMKVWNLIDAHRKDHFLQDIHALKWIKLFQGSYHR